VLWPVRLTLCRHYTSVIVSLLKLIAAITSIATTPTGMLPQTNGVSAKTSSTQTKRDVPPDTARL
jgi:hypothetical protein